MMTESINNGDNKKTIEPSIWQIMIQPMIAEYQALWTEMNNRWTQQQQIINTSWTVLAVFVAINQFIIQNSNSTNFDEDSIITLILLIPLSLSILCLVFIRNDDKNWRIVAYIYLELRPNVKRIYTYLYEYYQFNKYPDLEVLPSRIWNWGSYEIDKAFSNKLKEYLFHPWLDFSRYALMIIPSIIVVTQVLLKFRKTIFIDKFTFTAGVLYFDIFLVFISIAYCIVTLLQFRDLLGQLRKKKK